MCSVWVEGSCGDSRRMGLCGETTLAAIISHLSHLNCPIPINPTFLGAVFLITIPCLRPSMAPHFPLKKGQSP